MKMLWATVCERNFWNWSNGQYYVTIRAIGYSGSVSAPSQEVAFVYQREGGIDNTPPSPTQLIVR